MYSVCMHSARQQNIFSAKTSNPPEATAVDNEIGTISQYHSTCVPVTEAGHWCGVCVCVCVCVWARVCFAL